MAPRSMAWARVRATSDAMVCAEELTATVLWTGATLLIATSVRAMPIITVTVTSKIENRWAFS